MRFITTVLLFALLVLASVAAAFVVAVLSVLSGLVVLAITANEIVKHLVHRRQK